MNELVKPCPWCYEDELVNFQLEASDYSNKWVHLGCSCGARGPDRRRVYGDTKASLEAAVQAWNDRIGGEFK